MDRDIIQAKFTVEELKAIDKEFMNRAMATVDFYKTMPLSVVCANPSTPWWVLFDLFCFKNDGLIYLFRFPPFPAPLRWATRWWFAWWYNGAWEFGPLDFSGNERK